MGSLLGRIYLDSPKLVLIKILYGFKRRALRDFRYYVDNARQSVKDEADRRIKDWSREEDNNNLIVSKSSINRLKVLSNRYRRANFSNSFRDN